MRFLLVALCLAATVLAYPDGGPPDACGSLEPKHDGAKALFASSSPYQVTTSKLKYKVGEVVDVTIQAKKPGAAAPGFKGFMIAGRKANSKTNVGQFASRDGKAQAVLCPTGGNLATHVDASVKPRITVQWTPDANTRGSVTFTATIVESFDKYWTNVKSNAIAIN